MDLWHNSEFERVAAEEWKIGESSYQAGLLWCVGIGAYREQDGSVALSHHLTATYEIGDIEEFLEKIDDETTNYVVAGGKRMPRDDEEIDEVVENKLNQASGKWKDYRIGRENVYQHNLFVADEGYIVKSPTDEIREEWKSF